MQGVVNWIKRCIGSIALAVMFITVIGLGFANAAEAKSYTRSSSSFSKSSVSRSSYSSPKKIVSTPSRPAYSAPVSRPTVKSAPIQRSTPVIRSTPNAPARVVSSPQRRAVAPVRKVSSPTTVNKTTVIQKNYYGGSSRGGYGGNYGGGYGGSMGSGGGLGTSLLGGVAGGIGGAMLYDALTDDKPKAENTTTTQQIVEPAPVQQAPVESIQQEPAPAIVPPPYALPSDAPLMMAPQFYNGVKQ